MDLEGGIYVNPVKRESWRTVLTLAYQSFGVVYGDLSTSPLYVYKNAFAEDIEHSESNEEIYGVLSFVFWMLTLVPLLKYGFIVLRADDNGEGGTFALYSLLCRQCRVGFLPNVQLVDGELSAYKKADAMGFGDGSGNGEAAASSRVTASARLRRLLEKHRLLQSLLLVLALIGTCMVIGDGVLTPALSIFSAVSGLELSLAKEHHKYLEVPITCVILIFLFAAQHYGTHRIGFLFAPIVVTWLLCISMIGLYNIFHWNPHVYQALSPCYMYKFLKKTQWRGWMSLGGILLCITGSETMFADLGHFSQLSIKIAFTSVVYPSLILAYMGQAAYLSRHHIVENDYRIGFYVSVPEKLRWPVLAVAILAAVVGSQAVITEIQSTWEMPQVLVFLCIKSLPIPHVRQEERFLIGRIGPREFRVYRCIVRYGYHDIYTDDVEFEKDLVRSIAAFIQSTGSAEPNKLGKESVEEDDKMAVVGGAGFRLQELKEDSDELPGPSKPHEIRSPKILRKKKVRFSLPKSMKMDPIVSRELQDLMEEREAGMAFIMGHSHMKAKCGSSFIKKLAIGLYDFLRRNSRGPSYAVSLPHASTLEVGMVYLV